MTEAAATKTVFGSLARISDLETVPYELSAVPHANWQIGDYVVGEVTGEASELYRIEDTSGVMVPVSRGDRVVGALGVRAATLEGVGSYRDVVGDRMQAMTNAGLFGAFTSLSKYMGRPISLRYLGHVIRRGRPSRMQDFALATEPFRFCVPTILLIGTSMSSGKTMTGSMAVAALTQAGLTVTGAKLTGAGRYRDILSFRRHGARHIFDFVDAGLPSTILPEADFRSALRHLLARIDADRPDYLVAEAGASPLEPYNGAAAIELLGDNVVCSYLCASDPYAVVGVMEAFGFEPDIVAGPATNTTAGMDLVRKLTGLPAVSVLDDQSMPEFRKLLARKLGRSLDAAPKN